MVEKTSVFDIKVYCYGNMYCYNRSKIKSWKYNEIRLKYTELDGTEVIIPSALIWKIKVKEV